MGVYKTSSGWQVVKHSPLRGLADEGFSICVLLFWEVPYRRLIVSEAACFFCFFLVSLMMYGRLCEARERLA